MLQEQMAQNSVQEMAQEPFLKTETKSEHLSLSGEEGKPKGFFQKVSKLRFLD